MKIWMKLTTLCILILQLAAQMASKRNISFICAKCVLASKRKER